MSTEVTKTVLLDGPRHSIIHFYLKGGGADGELTDYELLDPTVDLDPPSDRLVIEHVLYDFAGFDATLEFDSGLPDSTMIWVLPEGSNNSVDFMPVGGFADRSGLDGTGKLLISTIGLTETTDQGSIILKLRKKSS